MESAIESGAKSAAPLSIGRRGVALEEPAWLAIRTRIETVTVKLCAQLVGSGLRAVILTGSAARDEVSFAFDGSKVNFLSDAEFIVIIAGHATLPSFDTASSLMKAIENQLEAEDIRCHVLVGFAHDAFLRKMTPHIFAYELRHCGRVAFGERDILSLIPSFAPEAIPLEDAWRLLSNRLVELVEVLATGPRSDSTDLEYRMVKLYLDMATSLLLFAGCYAPSYRQRSENLASARVYRVLENVPFDLEAFSQTVKACTDWKLGRGSLESNFANEHAVYELCRRVSQLWRWEVSRMAEDCTNLSPLDACMCLAKQQKFAIRIRGWLFVARREGWLRSWRNWPGWIRLAMHSSPRYCVYAAAAEVLARFGSPNQTGGAQDSGEWERFYRLLPVAPGSLKRSPDSAQKLMGAIAWNYHQFLEGTRG